MFEELILVGGFRKSGTSSLHNYIVSNFSEVTAPAIKEPQFLSLCDLSNREHMAWYEKLYGYNGRNIPLAVDSSTLNILNSDSYLAANKLAKKVKVLVVTRDPAKRLISSYWHMASKGNGHETRSLDDIVNSIPVDIGEGVFDYEDGLIKKAGELGDINIGYLSKNYLKELYGVGFTVNIFDPYIMYRYFGESLYSRWFNNFPTGDVFITSLEKLINDEGEVDRVVEYLGLDPVRPKKSFLSEKNRNKTYDRRGSVLAGLVEASVIKNMKKVLPQKLKEGIKSTVYGDVPKVSVETTKRIEKILRPEYEYWKASNIDLLWNRNGS
ncbi:sulfotransferase domain-containing protein [Chromohalobacter sp. 48-RD10]|uniref:sulfotransferase domain-containing protein n=1 Tax=Chromohalobacter sp. 48-RD10 TaxID=2994063 RepID=UPI0024696927|nr:sulfotransferase domain-containing protein [Chromohalobacter sp. 48-RD10]